MTIPARRRWPCHGISPSGLVIVISRFIPIIAPIAMAASLGCKKSAPFGLGTLRDDTGTFGRGAASSPSLIIAGLAVSARGGARPVGRASWGRYRSGAEHRVCLEFNKEVTAGWLSVWRRPPTGNCSHSATSSTSAPASACRPARSRLGADCAQAVVRDAATGYPVEQSGHVRGRDWRRADSRVRRRRHCLDRAGRHRLAICSPSISGSS